MKIKHKQILKFFLFVLILITLNQFFTHIYVNNIMGKSKYMRKLKAFESLPTKKLKHLVLGFSHTNQAINPEALENSFNFALPSANYIQIYYQMKYIFENMKMEIKNIYLSFEYLIFGIDKEKTMRNHYFWRKYVNYYEAGRKMNAVSRYLKYWFHGTFFPYVGESAILYQYLQTSQTVIYNRKMYRGFYFFKGIKFSANNKQNQKRMSIQRAKFQYSLFHTLYYQPIIDYFYKMVELCKKHEVRLILVRTPLHEEYVNQIKKSIKNFSDHKEKLMNVINIASKKYNQFFYFDLSKEFFGKPHLFTDPNHLNYEGSLAFTKILKEKMNLLNNKN